MKKRHLAMVATSIIMASCMSLGLAACGGNSGKGSDKHTHHYTWTVDENDSTKHNGVCDAKGDCDAKNVQEAHVYDNAEDATCNLCGYVRDLGGNVDDHVHNYTDWKVDENDATKHVGTCDNTDGKCDALTKTEDHVDTDEDNVCDKCEAEIDNGSEKPDPEPEIATHAQYMSAATGDKITVKGVVSGIVGNNVYLQDDDGGYYLYGVSNLDGVEAGKTITATGSFKDYNGCFELENVTVTVNDDATVNVTPKDITSLIASAESASAATLTNEQGTLVTIKNATLTKTGSNYYLSVGSVKVQLYVKDGQFTWTDDLKTALDAAVGSVVDVNAFATVFSKNLQLIPYNSVADTLHVYTTLKAPVLTLDGNKAKWEAVENATAYAYQLKKDGAWETKTPNLEATVTEFELEDGQSIRIMAIGGGDVKNSGWSNAVEYSSVVYPSVNMAYTNSAASGNLNPADGAGASNASLVGLNGYAFTVTTAKNEATTEVGLNKDGTIRLYSKKDGTGNGTSMTVTNNYQNIVSIKITLAAGSQTKFTSLKVVVDGNEVEGIIDTENNVAEYTINARSFTVSNTYQSTDNKQIWISEIEIEHVEYTAEQQAEMDAAAALEQAKAEAKENVAAVKNGLTLNATYTGTTGEEEGAVADVPVLPTSGDHSSVITWAVKTNGAGEKFTFNEETYAITIEQGDEDYNVTLTATITIYGSDGTTVLAQDTKDISFKIPKLDNGEGPGGGEENPDPAKPETHSIDLTEGFSNSYGADTQWANSYSKHETYITNTWSINSTSSATDLGTITFGAASKQTGTITDCPVFKGGTNGPTVAIGSGYTISAVTFTLKQWGTKTYTNIKIQYSTDGTTWKDSDVLHASGKLDGDTEDFSLTITDENIKYVRVSIDNTNNQIGVSAISLTVVPVAND